ncbi:cation:proton antiporter [Candidatus Woesearchaeota archaeon]|nr:cation:proton antiporter [Candidatus Woesearchaeota archaeon]
MIDALVMIVICLALAYFLSEFLRQLGLPRVVGQIFAGIILGIGVLKSMIFTPENMGVISFLANLGIIFLFFYVGLETNFSAFTKHIRQSVSISLINTFVPLIAGFLVMRYVFEFDAIISIIIGVSLSVSAQSVSVDLLEELRMLRSRIGSMIISAGAIDDIIEMILVTVLLSIFNVSITNATLRQLLPDIGLFLLLVVVARLWLIPYSLHYFDKAKSSTARFTWSLIIVLLIASLAELLHVGAVIGAMIAGIIIRQTIFQDRNIPDWEEHDIARSIHIVAFGFLIPMFFIWIGLNTNLSHFVQYFWFILLLALIATVGTVGGTAIALCLNKVPWKEVVTFGWGLNPKGDLELVIAALALKAGIIAGEIFTALVAMSLITTIISPIIFKRRVQRHKEAA